MVLQAYIDDSRDDNFFVLAGYIADAATWARFSSDWEELLPFGQISETGQRYFKMSEMSSPDALERTQAFWRVIERNNPIGLSVSFRQEDFQSAIDRFHFSNAVMEWMKWRNPYMFGFRALLDMFHSNRDKLTEFISLDEKVDFIFDEQNEKRPILAAWDDYIDARSPEMRKFYGATPRFEDDTEFLPLQAADLWAWWTRKWISDGKLRKDKFDFGAFERKQLGMRCVDFTFNEDEIFQNLAKIVRSNLNPWNFVYDLKTGCLI